VAVDADDLAKAQILFSFFLFWHQDLLTLNKYNGGYFEFLP
jgi:hypothetical protein